MASDERLGTWPITISIGDENGITELTESVTHAPDNFLQISAEGLREHLNHLHDTNPESTPYLYLPANVEHPGILTKPVDELVFFGGRICIDLVGEQLYFDEKAVHLPQTAYKLTTYLAQTPGLSRSKLKIMKAVWGTTQEVNVRLVDVHVMRARKALVKEAIVTRPGFGYFAAK